MDATTRRLAWLAGALGLALVVVIVDYVKYADAREEMIRGLHDDAARTWLRDDLVGRRLFDAEARVHPGRDGSTVRIAPDGEGLLLWVVDPARCVECLGELASARELRRRGGPRTIVVLSGPAADGGVAGAVRGGTVAFDRSGEWLATLTDGRLAGVALYADSAGVVLAAEGFDDRTACDWSFTASLGALLGHMDSNRARRDRGGAVPTLARRNPPAREDR